VARQVSVKAAHALWVTAAEHDAMTRILSDCPDELATTGVAPGVAPEPAAPEPEIPSNVYFPTCTAAREAGAAPVHAGDPGYGSHLDRDGDGSACE
jgi:hypothetical protein